MAEKETHFIYTGLIANRKGVLYHTYFDLGDPDSWDDFVLVDAAEAAYQNHSDKIGWFKKPIISGCLPGALLKVLVDDSSGNLSVLGKGREFIRMVESADGAVLQWRARSQAIREAKALQSKVKKEMRSGLNLDQALAPVAEAYHKLNRSGQRVLLAMVIDAVVNNREI